MKFNVHIENSNLSQIEKKKDLHVITTTYMTIDKYRK